VSAGGRAAILALAVALLLAAPAGAARKPVFLGKGGQPGVAVDAAGTAHVAWIFDGPAPDDDTLEYCQLPRRARACALRRSFLLGGSASRDVEVALPPRPGAVSIAAPVVNGRSLLFNSTDGGATFAALPLGELDFWDDAVYGPGDAFSFVTGPSGSYARYGLDGSGPPDYAFSFGGFLEAVDVTIAPWTGGLAIFASGDAGLRTLLWNGATDPNAPQAWAEGPNLGDDRHYVSAAGGRSGTFLAYVDRRPRTDSVYVRRLGANGRYGRAKRVVRDDPVELQLAEGPRGELALLYRGSSDARVVRSRTGRRWTRPRRLFRGNDFTDLAAALGPRGSWAVWDGDAGYTGDGTIRAVALPGRPRR
jgi:hypothetical protein